MPHDSRRPEEALRLLPPRIVDPRVQHRNRRLAGRGRPVLRPAELRPADDARWPALSLRRARIGQRHGLLRLLPHRRQDRRLVVAPRRREHAIPGHGSGRTARRDRGRRHARHASDPGRPWSDGDADAAGSTNAPRIVQQRRRPRLDATRAAEHEAVLLARQADHVLAVRHGLRRPHGSQPTAERLPDAAVPRLRVRNHVPTEPRAADHPGTERRPRPGLGERADAERPQSLERQRHPTRPQDLPQHAAAAGPGVAVPDRCGQPDARAFVRPVPRAAERHQRSDRAPKRKPAPTTEVDADSRTPHARIDVPTVLVASRPQHAISAAAGLHPQRDARRRRVWRARAAPRRAHPAE